MGVKTNVWSQKGFKLCFITLLENIKFLSSATCTFCVKFIVNIILKLLEGNIWNQIMILHIESLFR